MDQLPVWRLAAIVDSSFDAIVSKTLEGIITSWNRAAEEMFGYHAEEAMGQPIQLIIPDDRLEEEAEIIARIRGGERVPTKETVRRRKDGTVFPVSITVSPILDGSERVIGASTIARDISEAKENERHIRLLLREVHHRVKNNLQIISSLLQLQNLPADARHELSSRIMAIAAVHEQLHHRESSGRVDLARYIESLLRSVNASFEGEVRLDLQLDPVMVDADLATTIGLVVNELIYNTNKYAFPAMPKGTFGARLLRSSECSAFLHLFNDGVSFDADNANGIGIRLVRRLASTIDRAFTFDGTDGLRFEMTIPTAS